MVKKNLRQKIRDKMLREKAKSVANSGTSEQKREIAKAYLVGLGPFPKNKRAALRWALMAKAQDEKK